MNPRRIAAGLAVLILAQAAPALADDWPQWRGPNRSNVSTETGLLKTWPKEGPPLLWKTVGLGEGITSVSISRGRIYTMGYRDQAEFAFALEESTGRLVWAVPVGPAVPENPLMRWLGERSPTVDGDRVYVVTAEGELICLRTSDGKEVWRKSYRKDFKARAPFWRFCDHPLVDGDRLICTPGGPEATIVALDKITGAIVWKSAVPGKDMSSYSPLAVAEVAGTRHYVAFLSRGLVGVAAKDGKFLWRYDEIANGTGNSHAPVVRGNAIFCANGYGKGIALVKLVSSEGGVKAEKVYYQRMQANSIQDSSVPILVGEHIYTFLRARLACVEYNSGKLAWNPQQAAGGGHPSLTSADGQLYVRSNTGRMTLADATPDGYAEKGRFEIPDHQEAVGATAPVVANGRLYVRELNTLLCYDVRANVEQPRRQPRTVTLPIVLAPEGNPKELPRPRVGTNRLPDAVFVPTPQDVVEKLLELAGTGKKDVVYDLGSGDGRVVITAAKKYGAKAVGYEIDRELVRLSNKAAASAQVEELVRIKHEDIFVVDLTGADVVFVYLPPRVLDRLRPQLEKLKPGSRIVSHAFPMAGIKPDKVVKMAAEEDGLERRLYLYTAPLKKEE